MNRKVINKMLFLAMLGTASLSFSSCSESEDVVAGTLLVDPSYMSKGIETEVESAVIEVPVTCNGKWVAVVDSCDWLAILDDNHAIHQGNGVIKLKVDENRTQVGRKSTLSILDFNQNEIEIPVYQTNTYKGQPASNGAGDWFSKVGVGCGANYKYFMQPDANRGLNGKTFDPLQIMNNNNIFNFGVLETKQKTGSSKDSLYIVSRIPMAELKSKLDVNSIGKDETLDATIQMGCSFGFIEFEAKGHYVSSLTDTSATVNYTVCREAPVLNSRLQVSTIAAKADEVLQQHIKNDVDDDELDELLAQLDEAKRESKKKKLRRAISELYKTDFGGYFSAGFAQAYWTLYSTYLHAEDWYPNADDRKRALNDCLGVLDSNWGPYFISGGQFGGSLNMLASVQKKDLDEDTKFDADITANIADGFQLSGDVAFSAAGKQLYKHSDVVMYVYGGNAAVTLSGVTDFLDSDMTNTKELQSILNEWANSFAKFDGDGDSAVPTNAAPISFNLTPIWTVFQNQELQAIVKDYFMEKYKDKGIETWDNVVKGNISSLGDLLASLAGQNKTTNKKDDSSKKDNTESGTKK